MSSIGFAPGPGSEVEQLRSAYRSLNDVTRNLASVAKCIKGQDLRMAEHHLRAAEWHLGEAKRMIAAVGQTKSGRTFVRKD
jgi:hypothetical protein